MTARGADFRDTCSSRDVGAGRPRCQPTRIGAILQHLAALLKAEACRGRGLRRQARKVGLERIDHHPCLGDIRVAGGPVTVPVAPQALTRFCFPLLQVPGRPCRELGPAGVLVYGGLHVPRVPCQAPRLQRPRRPRLHCRGRCLSPQRIPVISRERHRR